MTSLVSSNFKDVPLGILVVALTGLLIIYGFTFLMLFGKPILAINAYLQLIYFSVLILSFLGAINWGLAISAESRGIRISPWWYIAAAGPTALGWIALVLISPTIKIVVLSLGFFSSFMLDVTASSRGYAPVWYKNLRKLMTTAVLIAMTLALLAVRLTITSSLLG